MHSPFIKLAAGVACVMVLFVGANFARAASLTDAQIQAIVGLLQSFDVDKTTIANVQAVLDGRSISQPAAGAPACVDLSANLYPDITDEISNGQVTKLQQFLALDASIYPEGRVTGYFGPATLAGVQRWQSRHSIVSSGDPDTTGYGFAGPKTRLAMACGPATSPSQTVRPSPSMPFVVVNADTSTSTVPATPATPATPAAPAISATPATPATPATAASSTATSDTTAPSVPTGLSASAVSTSQINLAWSASTDAVGVTGYKVYRDGAQVSTTGAPAASTTISYSDRGLSADTSYTYTVAAYDAAGNTSAQSASASATTQTPPPPPPPPPPDPTPDPASACLGGNGRTPGLPNCLMPENLAETAWNEVDNATGKVIGGAVCSVAVCGRNGEWRKIGYPANSTYIQTPFDSAYWGQYFTNGVWQTGNGGIVQPGSSQITYP